MVFFVLWLCRPEGSRYTPGVSSPFSSKPIASEAIFSFLSLHKFFAAVAASGPNRIVVAVPAGARDTVERLRGSAEVVSVVTPGRFRAVGEWYDDFRQTSDEEVMEVLAESGREPPG